MKIALVVGARPNFVKAAPLVRELRGREGVSLFLIHTGQHYDEEMSGRFLSELDITAPDVNLGVGSGSNAWQIGTTIVRIEPVLLRERPDFLVVVGDVNATVAATLTAQAHRVPVAHVEAGLRSFDRSMPEEVNRVVVDTLADLLFTSCPDAGQNLIQEGVRPERIHFVGNIMIDTLVAHLDAARRSSRSRALDLPPQGYAVLTLHRSSNVDSPTALRRLVEVVDRVQKRIPVVFTVHPRTRRRLEELGLDDQLEALPGVRLLPPVTYREFLSLEADAAFVMTDSGGVQEETTFLGVPCLTLRENTERPVTVREGTNEVVGADVGVIELAVESILRGRWKPARIPDLWDGKTAGRIVDALLGRSVGPNGRGR